MSFSGVPDDRLVAGVTAMGGLLREVLSPNPVMASRNAWGGTKYIAPVVAVSEVEQVVVVAVGVSCDHLAQGGG